MDRTLRPPRRLSSRGARVALLGIAVAMALPAGCGGSVSEQSTPSAGVMPSTAVPTARTTSGACSLPPGHSELEINGAAPTRVVDVVAPGAEEVDGRTVPLIVDLHGYSESSDGHGAIDGFAARAPVGGFIVATPDALGSPSLWNATNVPGLPDDVAFIGFLLERLVDTGCVDRSRVAVVGGSNGAFMASMVGCRLANLVTTIAPVAGAILPRNCAPSSPVSVLAIHGDADQLVPLSGGLGPEADDLPPSRDALAVFSQLPVMPVPQALDGWAQVSGCAESPVRSGSQGPVERIEWSGCNAGAHVRLDVVHGAGHVWPGSAALRTIGVDERSAAMVEDATEEIIRFVFEHPRAG